jgi:hypothetical protein
MSEKEFEKEYYRRIGSKFFGFSDNRFPTFSAEYSHQLPYIDNNVAETHRLYSGKFRLFGGDGQSLASHIASIESRDIDKTCFEEDDLDGVSLKFDKLRIC